MRKKIDEQLKNIKNPVLIFDLDGTLFDVTYRSLEILQLFAAEPEIRKDFEDFLSKISKITHADFQYSLEKTLQSAGIDRYSERSIRFLNSAVDYWSKRFFKDEYLAHDKPFAGAVACVKHYHSAGVHICYLSGRDTPNMSKGTIEALETHGFPHTGNQVSMYFKPSYGQDDLFFKQHSVAAIRHMGGVAATFDNEPANVEMFQKEFPAAFHVHVESPFARHIELGGKNLGRIKTFKDLGF